MISIWLLFYCPSDYESSEQDLCKAALTFALETLKPNGHFVCKFYQGSEDRLLETALRQNFAKVFRQKPSSSRSVRPGLSFTSSRRADTTLSPGVSGNILCGATPAQGRLCQA